MSGNSTAASVSVRHTHRADAFVAVPRDLGEAILARTARQRHAQTVLELAWAASPGPGSVPAAPDQHPRRVYVAWAGEFSRPIAGSASPSSSMSGLRPGAQTSSLLLGTGRSRLAGQDGASGMRILEIDTKFALALGLPMWAQVTVKVCRHVASAARVYMVPASPDDWELVSLHAGAVERDLLRCLRVVFPGQRVPVPLPGNTHATLIVNHVDVCDGESASAAATSEGSSHGKEPAQAATPRTRPRTSSSSGKTPDKVAEVTCALLDIGSEIAIQPMTRARRSKHGEEAAAPPRPMGLVLRSYHIEEEHALSGLDRYLEDPSMAVVHPADWQILVRHIRHDSEDQPRTDYVAILQILRPTLLTPSMDKKAPSGSENGGASSTAAPSQEGNTLRVLLTHHRSVPKGAIACNDSLGLQLSQRARPSLPHAKFNMHGIPVKCILAEDQIVKDDTDTLQKKAPPLTTTAPGAEFKDRYLLEEEEGMVPPVLGGRDEQMQQARAHLFNARVPGCLLVSGAPGTGKTSFAVALLLSLDDEATDSSTLSDSNSRLLERSNPHLMASGEIIKHIIPPYSQTAAIYVPCPALGQLSVDRSRAFLHDIAAMAHARAPSVVVLDDAHVLIPGEGESMDASDQLAQVIVAMAKGHLPARPTWTTQLASMAGGGVRLVLTAPDASSLHKSLSSQYAIAHEILLGQGGRTERQQVFDAIARAEYPLDSDVDLTMLLTQTDGYVARDYAHILSRAHLESLRDGSASTTITQSNLNQALEGYTPSNVARANASTSGKGGKSAVTDEADWSRVGALADVRRVLRETLEWPAQFPQIFAQSPLRLRSGVLLYGYPGTGKTLAARAAARASRLPLLAVKGPELLSKYIGESEAGVRNLFARARAAAPCVVLLDEIDALAPRRGSDNSGATDRVVNQLLTELDGAEGMGKGVYVVGTTSRPDLVDPALLRPGRIDKAVLCDMPDAEAREAILQVVVQHASEVQCQEQGSADIGVGTSGMVFSDDVNWKMIADQAAGFSGADLQALVYSAYLGAVQGIMETHNLQSMAGPNQKERDEMSEEDEGAVPIPLKYKADPPTAEHALRALLRNGMVTSAGHNQKSDPGQRQAVSQRSSHQRRQIAVTAAHVLRAFEETRPSVSPDLRARLARVYRRFATGAPDLPTQQLLTLK